MPNLEGQILKDRYRIDELIGRGGMAEVYKAWDTHRQYHVAIKVMREDLAEDTEFLRRFRREAKALSQLAHENIVRFYSFEREDLLAFIVMDYVEGTTLRSEIVRAEGPLSLAQVRSVASQVCAALHYAHQEGVVHRDVKPGNVMIRSDGRVLVADFGIAKAADAATATTVMPGTPAYMSPEQCRSELLDARADVYSLGIVVYEMLAGRRPFVGDTEATTGSTREKLRWEQIHASPPPLQDVNLKLPVQVEKVVLKALAKEPDDRWQTVLAFWQALDEALAIAGQPGAKGETDAVPEGERIKSRFAHLAGVPTWVWVAGVAGVFMLLCILSSGLAGWSIYGTYFSPTPTTIRQSTFTPISVETKTPIQKTTQPSTVTPKLPTLPSTLTPTRVPPTPTRTLAPTRSPTATPTPSSYARVTANTLNIRNGPGTNYDQVAQVHKGDQLVILGRNSAGDWLKVTAPGNITGWVTTEYVALSALVEDIPVAVVPPTRTPNPAANPRFRADRTSINAGECTYLRWDVDGVQAVYLDGAGKPGHSTERVCPGQTRTYALKVVLRDGQENLHSLTIYVSGSLPLTIAWKVQSIWCTSKYSYAADIYVSASGGKGMYTYYRDIDKIGGPVSGGITYRLWWTSCGGAPGTFHVKSGDGQEAQDKFWINPPACCGK